MSDLEKFYKMKTSVVLVVAVALCLSVAVAKRFTSLNVNSVPPHEALQGMVLSLVEIGNYVEDIVEISGEAIAKL